MSYFPGVQQLALVIGSVLPVKIVAAILIWWPAATGANDDCPRTNAEGLLSKTMARRRWPKI